MKTPTLSLSASLIPLVILILMLTYNIYIFGDNALNGSNQFILLVGGAVAGIVGVVNKVSYARMLQKVGENIQSVTGPILILLMVGAMAGTWLLSGIIPTMIDYGQVYKRLGAEVSVIEYADRITPVMDSALSRELTKVMKKQKIKFYLSHQVNKVERKGDTVSVTAVDKKGAEVVFEGDYCLVSVGRKPYTEGLNAAAAGVELSERGQVQVNDHLQTTAANIYAIGDVVKGAMLAHKAEEEGVMVAEILAGQKPHIDYNLIPNVIYTWPEVAAVGKTEEELKTAGVAYKSGQFPMRALGRSRASGDTDGFIKILADASTDEVLGVHMIGPRVADLIAEAVVAMEFRASAEDIARMSHSHPTYAEAVKEAALAASEDRALHM